MLMRWESLLFIHWRVQPEVVQRLIPAGLTVDTFDGSAWVGLVPFTMPRVRHARWFTLPTMRAFHECNVRTYVRAANGESKPGVYFFSLDAASRLAVFGARWFWGLNYKHSRIDMARDGEVVRYSVKRLDQPRASMRCAWRIGGELPAAQAGSLEYFLTERYCLYSARHNGIVGACLRGDIHHEPWMLRRAEVLELKDGLVRAAGIEVNGARPDSVFHADVMDVEAWGLR